MRWRRRFEVVVEGESGSAISQRSVISEHRTEKDAREAAAQERRRLEVIRAEEAADWVIWVVRGDEVLHEERPFDGRREAVPSPLEPLRIMQAEPEAEPEVEPEPEGDGSDGAPDDAGDHGGGDTGTFPAPEASADDAAEAEDATDDEHEADEPAAPEPVAADDAPAPDAPTGSTGAAAIGARPVGEADLDPAPEFTAAPRRATASDADAGATGQVRRIGGDPSARRRDADPVPSGPVPEEVIRRFEESLARERERAGRRRD